MVRSLILILFFFSSELYALVPPALTTYDELAEEAENVEAEDINSSYWLIVIGIEEYDETDAVVFSTRSTNAFTIAAQRRLGISKRRSMNLVGDRATSGRIKDNMTQILQRVQPGDTIFFYYSGHGIPDIKTNEPYLLPKDKLPETVVRDDFFKLKNIYAQLSASKASKVVAFVDSCFSGSTDNKSLFHGVAAARLQPKQVSVDRSKMVVISAGTGEQFSNMYKEKRHRLFTYYLTKGLIKGKSDIKSLYHYIKENVEETSFELGESYLQSPTIEGDLQIVF
ncbi:MAG: caspase family protein [Gammaproteobacteria bacterium]|nr:caspase family protein [Gammaproteobacteria bacterium]